MPFICFVHYIDEASNNSIKVKMYDFQVYCYETFALDLIFFLFTSVRSIDLVNNFKSFINHYHEEFIQSLKLVNCPLEDYVFEKWAQISAQNDRMLNSREKFQIFFSGCGMRFRTRPNSLWVKLFLLPELRWQITIKYLMLILFNPKTFSWRRSHPNPS